MQNPQETPVVSPEVLEAKKIELLNEISRLGRKLDEANIEDQKYQRALDEKTIELESILHQIEDNKPLLVASQQELKNTQDQVNEAKIILAQFDSKKGVIEETKTQIFNLTGIVKDLQGQSDALQVKINGFTKSFADLENQKDAKLEELKKLESDFVSRKASLQDEVDVIKLTLNDLKAEYAGLSKNSESIGLEISSKKSDLEKVNVELESASKLLISTNASIEKSKSDFEKECADRTAVLNDREAAIEKREGDASLKESWLKTKMDALRAIKTEMEVYLARKIPVNIPDEDAVQ